MLLVEVIGPVLVDGHEAIEILLVVALVVDDQLFFGDRRPAASRPRARRTPRRRSPPPDSSCSVPGSLSSRTGFSPQFVLDALLQGHDRQLQRFPSIESCGEPESSSARAAVSYLYRVAWCATPESYRVVQARRLDSDPEPSVFHASGRFAQLAGLQVVRPLRAGVLPHRALAVNSSRSAESSTYERSACHQDRRPAVRRDDLEADAQQRARPSHHLRRFPRSRFPCLNQPKA